VGIEFRTVPAREVPAMQRSYPLAALLCCVLLAGCNTRPPLGKVTGQVTYRGVPVSEGSIIFSDDSQGLSYVSDLDTQGRFVFQVAQGYGLPPGTYQVAIRPPRPSKPSLEYVTPKFEANKEYPNIPKPYREHATSGLTAVVKAGANEPYVFEMR
jgi:hypothetical protein